MKIFEAFIRTMLFLLVVLFIAALATFFLLIFIPDQVIAAFSIIKNFLSGGT